MLCPPFSLTTAVDCAAVLLTGVFSTAPHSTGGEEAIFGFAGVANTGKLLIGVESSNMFREVAFSGVDAAGLRDICESKKSPKEDFEAVELSERPGTDRAEGSWSRAGVAWSSSASWSSIASLLDLRDGVAATVKGIAGACIVRETAGVAPTTSTFVVRTPEEGTQKSPDDGACCSCTSGCRSGFWAARALKPRRCFGVAVTCTFRTFCTFCRRSQATKSSVRLQCSTATGEDSTQLHGSNVSPGGLL